jgi:hypothetical protein
MRFISCVSAGLSLLLLTGCVIRKDNGSVEKHVVIGFGVVSVHRVSDKVDVRSVISVGIFGGPDQVGIGYTDTVSAFVNDGTTNVILEIRK